MCGFCPLHEARGVPGLNCALAHHAMVSHHDMMLAAAAGSWVKLPSASLRSLALGTLLLSQVGKTGRHQQSWFEGNCLSSSHKSLARQQASPGLPKFGSQGAQGPPQLR